MRIEARLHIDRRRARSDPHESRAGTWFGPFAGSPFASGRSTSPNTTLSWIPPTRSFNSTKMVQDREPPHTKATGGNEAEATVSATGMPRIIPRHRDERPASEQDLIDEKDGSAPSEMESDAPSDAEHSYPPTGSLTLAAFNPYSSIPLPRRLALISSSVAINFGLPFLNGVMLGFGEIFARVILAPALGITGVGWAGDTARAIANWNWLPKSKPASDTQSRQYQSTGQFDDWSTQQSNTTQHFEL